MISYSVKTKKATIVETPEETFTEVFEQIQKLQSLTNWFNTYFRMQLEQHSWQTDYKPSEDTYFKNEDGTPKTYTTFEEVTEQAQFVRNEIKRLKESLKTDTNQLTNNNQSVIMEVEN